MSGVFIDASGRYYKADKAKDIADSSFVFPTVDMLTYLTETPVTPVEFSNMVTQAKVAALNIQPIAQGAENAQDAATTDLPG